WLPRVSPTPRNTSLGARRSDGLRSNRGSGSSTFLCCFSDAVAPLAQPQRRLTVVSLFFRELAEILFQFRAVLRQALVGGGLQQLLAHPLWQLAPQFLDQLLVGELTGVRLHRAA